MPSINSKDGKKKAFSRQDYIKKSTLSGINPLTISLQKSVKGRNELASQSSLNFNSKLFQKL